jgi:HNH endonuclease
MDEQLRQTVRERADHRCEYCCLPQDAEPFFAYHVEHIVARQHGGSDDNKNLALAGYHCNAHKGPNLSALDPESGALFRLFNPRLDKWEEHFERKRSPYCRANRDRPSDGRPVENERRGSATTSRTIALLPMSDRSSAQEIIEDRQPDAKSLIFSSHFLVNSSQKNGLFRCLWFVKIRQASPSKK